MTQADRSIAVFDLDGTLIAGGVFAGFLRHLVSRAPVRVALAVLTAPEWLPLLAVGATRMLAERYLVYLATTGLDEQALERLAHQFALHHAGPEHGRVAAEGLDRVQEHLRRGDRVIIATECPEVLADQVCTTLGLHDVEVIASPLTRGRWGLWAGARPCRGEGKVRALAEAGIDLPVQDAYSDSLSDLPLLRAARTAHVVTPRPRHRTRFRRELGHHVDMLDWVRSSCHPNLEHPASGG